jgi:hypothetical protein
MTMIAKTAACLVGTLALFVQKPALHATEHPEIPADVHSSIATRHAYPYTATRPSTHAADYSRVPVYFEVNRGQAASGVNFLARGPGYSLFLTSTEAVVTLPSGSRPLRMKFIGAHANARVIGRDELPGRVNYLVGTARASWYTDIPTYAKVEYRNVYPGVDLVYSAVGDQVKYDLIVAPGRDPGSIALGFEGANRIELMADGDLMLRTEGGAIRHEKPVVYQQIGESRRAVDGRYVLRGSHQVGFEVGAYDASRPLVIDPALAFSSYLGGSGFDQGWRVALDAAGNIYFTGTTASVDFPTANATPIPGGNELEDAFVVKVSADGSTLLYATYFGGAGFDQGRDIAVRPDGRVYVTGWTQSADFPTHNAIQPTYGGLDDGFVVQLDPEGDAFVYSTYLGGSQFDIAASIAVDAAGAAYVAGSTASRDFPTENPFQRRLRGTVDAFVTKLSPTGALVYSTYLGGRDQFPGDSGQGIAVDSTGHAYVIGSTASHNFPTRHALQRTLHGDSDSFVTKLSDDGDKLVFSTFLGGAGPDTGIDIAVDASNRASVVGHTSSTDFPTVSAIQAQSGGSADVFVARFDAEGRELLFSTYLGGSEFDAPGSIAVDNAANVYVAGHTSSLDFPRVDAFQPVFGGDIDAFVAKLSANGTSLVYSSYLGGEALDLGVGIAADSAGNAYVTGVTKSEAFPVVNALQPELGGEPDPNLAPFDAFFAKIVP